MNMTRCCTLFTSGKPPSIGRPGGVSGCHVEQCENVRRILESIHLIQLGARVGLVGQLTGLEKKTLKRMYRQLMGKPSPSGQLPSGDSWFLENDQRLFQTTLIWHLYRRLNRPDCRPARILINVFEVYTQLVGEPMLDMTRTAFSIQLFTSGVWNQCQCSHCSMAFPAPADSNRTTCPGCRLYYRYRCHRCRSQLNPRPKGRRRATCSHCGATLKSGFEH